MAQTRRFRGGKSMHRTGGRRTKSMRGGAGYNIYLEDGTPYLHFRTNSRFSSNDMSVEKLLEKLDLGQGERADTSTNETITGLSSIQKILEDESAAEQGEATAANYYTANMFVRPDHRSRDSNLNNVIIVRHKNQNEARRIFNEQSGIARHGATSMNKDQHLSTRDRNIGVTQNNLQPGEDSGNRLRDLQTYRQTERSRRPTYRGTARSMMPTSSSPTPYLSDDDSRADDDSGAYDESGAYGDSGADDDSGAYGESGRGRKKKKEKKSRKKKKKKHKKKKKGGSFTHARR